MIALACLVASGVLTSAALPPDDEVAMPVFAQELPGYYEFYKRSGPQARLDEEVVRDDSLAEGGEWAPVEVEIPAPALELPGSDGVRRALRVGGSQRNTVVTTFQAWW